MSQPIIFCIDDDVYVLRALVRDLKNNYRENYRVLSTTTVKEGLASLLELKNTGEIVAMYITDQRMPEMDGIAFLEQAIKFYPDAKRLLLTCILWRC
jgi:thioredoxin reductase (NADPH)